MSNAAVKCPGCGTEVYRSLLGGVLVDYRRGIAHDCPTPQQSTPTHVLPAQTALPFADDTPKKKRAE